jgi:hypothetical protein
MLHHPLSPLIPLKCSPMQLLSLISATTPGLSTSFCNLLSTWLLVHFVSFGESPLPYVALKDRPGVICSLQRMLQFGLM